MQNKTLELKKLTDALAEFINKELAPGGTEYTFAFVNLKQVIHWVEDGLYLALINKDGGPNANAQ